MVESRNPENRVDVEITQKDGIRKSIKLYQDPKRSGKWKRPNEFKIKIRTMSI
jgi:hypothetical protein